MEEKKNQGTADWKHMSNDEKLAAVESVLDEEIRPYVAMDGGGVEVVELQGENKLIISYKGACAHCFAATGATLSYIQQVLREKVSGNIEVVPKF